MTTRADIIRVVETYANLPFKHAGRTEAGMDCVALGIVTARRLKIKGWERISMDESLNAYPIVRPPGFLKGKLDLLVREGILRRIDRDKVQPADMLLRWVAFGRDNHVSILIGPNVMVEASVHGEARFPKGRIKKTIITPREWRSVVCGYQFMDIDE